MKAIRLGLALSALVWLSGVAGAEETEAENLTLEDVIFDSSYLAQFLGPKTLLQFEGDAAPIIAALAESGLAKKTTFIKLPAQVRGAKPKYETPPNLPESMSWQDISAEADFLIYVSAEGKVECLYCYKQTHRIYALAVARAILKWRFDVAKAGETALPVLYHHSAKFSGALRPIRNDKSNDTNNLGDPTNTPMPQTAAGD